MKKKKMYFVANWLKDRPRTWSGIVYGLFNALGKYYEMDDIDVNYPVPLFFKVLNKAQIYTNRFGGRDLLKKRKRTEGYIKEGIVFQFEEVVRDTDHRHTYVFQDCSTDYVYHIATTDRKKFLISNFNQHSVKDIAYRRRLQNPYYESCSGIFTLCRWLVDDLVNRTGVDKRKVHYVGSGINVDVEKIDTSHKEHNKLLFVGRDFKRKGGYVVLEAYKLLREKMPNAELYVVGPPKNPFSKPMDGYHYLGDCNKQQLNDLYNKCDVFCMPSYFECFGIVFVEALTFGLPCIGRDCYDMPFVIDSGKTGECIKDDNPVELAEIMYKILNTQLYYDNVEANRDFYVKEYSWDTVAERIYSIISKDNKDLLNNNNG